MEQQNEQSQNINVKVDPETYLEIQLAKIDDDIAEAEIVAVKAQLKVAEIKRLRTKAFVDFHFNKLKHQQLQEQAAKSKIIKQSQQAQQNAVPFEIPENIDSKPDTTIKEDEKLPF